MVDPPARTIENTRDLLHDAIRAGCRFAFTTFQDRQPDGMQAIGAAIVLASAAYSVGIIRALGAPQK